MAHPAIGGPDIVHRFTRHFRGLLVALATLALSASMALAARPASVEVPPADAPPPAADHGLSIAAGAAGKTVPVREDGAAEPDADEDAPDADEAPDAGGEAANADRPQNHGWFVSEAAKGATPETAVNHGQHVSEVARSDAGKPETATAAADRGASAAAAAKAAKPAKGPKAGH
jgi:hypothetical protein